MPSFEPVNHRQLSNCCTPFWSTGRCLGVLMKPWISIKPHWNQWKNPSNSRTFHYIILYRSHEKSQEIPVDPIKFQQINHSQFQSFSSGFITKLRGFPESWRGLLPVIIQFGVSRTQKASSYWSYLPAQDGRATLGKSEAWTVVVLRLAAAHLDLRLDPRRRHHARTTDLTGKGGLKKRTHTSMC